MRWLEPHKSFEAVVATLKANGGRVLWAGRTPIGLDALHVLVGARLFTIQVFERDAGSGNVLSFEVLTAIRGGMDAKQLGRELTTIAEADRAQLAAELGLVPPPQPGPVERQTFAEQMGLMPRSDLGAAEAIENRRPEPPPAPAAVPQPEPSLYLQTASPRRRRRRETAAMSST